MIFKKKTVIVPSHIPDKKTDEKDKKLRLAAKSYCKDEKSVPTL